MSPLWMIFLEIFAFWGLVQNFGFLMTFGGYALSSAVGLLICVLSFRTLATLPRQGLTSIVGLMDRSVFLVSGILLALPFLTTKLLGLLLWVPGLRWLVLSTFKGFQRRRAGLAGWSAKQEAFRQEGARQSGPFVFSYQFRSSESPHSEFSSRESEGSALRDVSPVEPETPDQISGSVEIIDVESTRLDGPTKN